MRILGLTYGTEGDTRPMVALCRGLLDAGHDVTLLAERSGASYAATVDVPFVPLAGDMAEAMRSAAAGLTHRGADVHYVARTLAAIANADADAWMRATLEHARGADVMLAAGLAIYVGLSSAETLGIRVIGVGLQPMMPTRAFASPFLPALPLPGFLKRASHTLVLAMMWRSFRRAINDARRAVADADSNIGVRPDFGRCAAQLAGARIERSPSRFVRDVERQHVAVGIRRAGRERIRRALQHRRVRCAGDQRRRVAARCAGVASAAARGEHGEEGDDRPAGDSSRFAHWWMAPSALSDNS